MLELLRSSIEKKRVLLLGFGREGQSTLRRLLQAGGYASITIADKAGANPPEASFAIPVLSGDSYMDTLDNYDLVFKSPGIVLQKSPEHYACRITSQTELFFEAFRERVIGITGTKGKSTATTLIHHILKESGRDVLLAGNIGIPVFDILEKIGEKTLVVCELSCHQLEYVHVSPRWAVLLNIHEEHLDHYGTFARYIHSKQQIYLHQKADDLLLCSLDVLPKKGTCPSRIYTVSDRARTADVLLHGSCIHFGQGSYQIPVDEIQLLGHHNHLDVAFAYALCHLLNLSDEEFDTGLKSYEPLPHRLHYIGERDGVRYYDDSISTIGETAIQALKSVPSVGSVLIGGMDRGICYDNLITFLSENRVPYIILMAATGRRIYEEIRRKHPGFQKPGRLLLVDTLEEAVEKARELTPPGFACVLSPAAASYGIFRDFAQRGDVFKELVFSPRPSPSQTRT